MFRVGVPVPFDVLNYLWILNHLTLLISMTVFGQRLGNAVRFITTGSILVTVEFHYLMAPCCFKVLWFNYCEWFYRTVYLEYLFEDLYLSNKSEEARKHEVSEAGCAELGESVPWAVAPSPSPWLPWPPPCSTTKSRGWKRLEVAQ